MSDLYAAIAVMGAISAALFLAGRSLARAVGPVAFSSVALLACTFVVAFASVLRDGLWMTRLLPFSGVVVLGNWLLPAVCLLAGLAWRRTPGGRLRKAALLLPLVLLCVFQSYGWLLNAPLLLDDRWKDGVCRQSSAASCSAAAAATLLRAHGIDATEAEMVRLCLTGDAGTSMHGLYRGLKRKTAGTRWDVQAFRGTADSLGRDPRPVILSVRLDRRPDIDPRDEASWGWAPGVAHTVVLFRFCDGTTWEVGDPSVGREHWRTRDLKVLWHGEGIRLVPR